jgi:hypothetical protein
MWGTQGAPHLDRLDKVACAQQRTAICKWALQPTTFLIIHRFYHLTSLFLNSVTLIQILLVSNGSFCFLIEPATKPSIPSIPSIQFAIAIAVSVASRPANKPNKPTTNKPTTNKPTTNLSLGPRSYQDGRLPAY